MKSLLQHPKLIVLLLLLCICLALDNIWGIYGSDGLVLPVCAAVAAAIPTFVVIGVACRYWGSLLDFEEV